MVPVLEARHDWHAAARLQPAHLGRPKLADERRLLAETLVRAPPAQVARHGHTRREEEVQPTSVALLGGDDRKLLDEGQAGENVGLLLRGTKREEVERGMVVIKPGTTTPHTNFDASVYILSKEEGGRHTPFFNNYRPQFYFRTTDVTGVVTLPEGTEMVMPGDNTEMSVELIQPVAMDEGLRFAIREGGRTVGAGQVTKIIK